MKVLCPDGVEYRRLGEIVSKLVDGMHSLPAGLLSSGKYPVISAQNISDDGEIDMSSNKYADEETFTKENARTRVHVGDVLLTIVGTIGRTAIVSEGQEMLFQRSVCVITPDYDKVISGFLRYVLNSSVIQNVIQRNAHGAVQKGLYLNQIEKILIPVPPLEVQHEIVNILDKFTELISLLERELELRRKQYDYYRDKLINTDYPHVKLSDIATITRGGTFQKKDFAPDGRPCIHYGQIHTHYGVHTSRTLSCVSPETFDRSRKAQPGDIVMATTSEDVEGVCKCVAWLGDEPVAVSGHTAIIHHEQDAKYLSFFFQSEIFRRQKRRIAHGVKVVEVTPDALKDISITLPPIERQQEISATLDKFNTLCTSLSEGLPAEIEARRKQYEHYRDTLLTFKPM